MRPKELLRYFAENPLNVKKLSQILLGPQYSSEDGSEYLATFFIELQKMMDEVGRIQFTMAREDDVA